MDSSLCFGKELRAPRLGRPLSFLEHAVKGIERDEFETIADFDRDGGLGIRMHGAKRWLFNSDQVPQRRYV